jgi:hypothetical protein
MRGDGGLLGASISDAPRAMTITRGEPACRSGIGPRGRAAAAADRHRGLKEGGEGGKSLSRQVVKWELGW